MLLQMKFYLFRPLKAVRIIYKPKLFCHSVLIGSVPPRHVSETKYVGKEERREEAEKEYNGPWTTYVAMHEQTKIGIHMQ